MKRAVQSIPVITNSDAKSEDRQLLERTWKPHASVSLFSFGRTTIAVDFVHCGRQVLNAVAPVTPSYPRPRLLVFH